MANSALFTPVNKPEVDDNVIDTGVFEVLGTVNSGSLLPVKAATQWAIYITPSGQLDLVLNSVMQQTDVFDVVIEDTELDTNVATFGTADGNSTWSWTDQLSLYNTFGVGDPVNASLTVGVSDDFNCDCEMVSPFDTLANVRKAMLIRLGYPNQSTNPPPGMPTLIDQHLRDAQKQIYRTITRAGKRTERFFKWTMEPGVRYYNFADEELSCNLLDPNKLSWVGFEDLNKAWYRLDEGIDPVYYTRANINFGWPTRYEIRSCIEIFPPPQAAYTLWIKGDFGLAPLVADSDRFTIDDQACFLLALGNMKTDRGAKDAALVLKQASDYVMGIVAGTHGTARYVPRTISANPLTPPRFLPLGDDQA